MLAFVINFKMNHQIEKFYKYQKIFSGKRLFVYMACVGRFYITHLNKHIPMKIYAIYFCFREGLKFPRTFQHERNTRSLDIFH